MSTFKKTEDQKKATDLLLSDATNVLLYGGSRSGKTFLLLYALFMRASFTKSRHSILRYRFNHAKQSLVYGTIPDLFKICFPDYGPSEQYLNKSDWFYRLPNGSEVWIGGLDDKERTEKILGNEYSTMYFNECSQMNYASVLKARTRLAEKTTLKNKLYYDENPPSRAHWTYREFIEHINPVTSDPIAADNYVSMLMNPDGNKTNIADNYLEMLAAMPEEERNRFLLGKWGEAVTGAVYGKEMQFLYKDKRITNVPHDPDYPVHTFWDLGINDTTAIWFMQEIGREIRVFDYYEHNGEDIPHYAQVLKRKNYTYEELVLPHDGANKSILNKKSAANQLETLGFKTRVLPRTASVISDLYVVKTFLRRCVFDKVKCQRGLEALESYHRDWDDDKSIYKDKPVHDWSSNGCDAFRYMAMNYETPTSKRIVVPQPNTRRYV